MNYELGIMGNFLKLFFVISAVILTSAACGQKPSPAANVNAAPAEKTDAERAVEAAKKVFNEQKAVGIDMSAGPCLSNEIIPNWVVDVVHNPRQAIDNLTVNQCSAYREGKAHHFVELDPEGNLVRVK